MAQEGKTRHRTLKEKKANVQNTLHFERKQSKKVKDSQRKLTGRFFCCYNNVRNPESADNAN